VGFGGYVGPPAPPGAGSLAEGFERALVHSGTAEGIRALLSLRAFEPPRPRGPARVAFAAGDAAMYFGHGRELAALDAAIGTAFAWNIAPLPRFPVRPAVPVQAQGLAAVTREPQRRAAAEALALLGMTPEGQRALAPTGAGVPALRALADSPRWRVALPPVDLNVLVRDPGADLVVPRALFHVGPAQAVAELLRGPGNVLSAAVQRLIALMLRG